MLNQKLIWLRAFHEIYNPELAIKVIARLKTKFPNIILSMIGPDKGDGSMQRTRQLAVQLNIEEFADFPGKATKDEASDG